LRILHSSSRDLLDSDKGFVEDILVKREDSVNDHGSEEGGLGVNEFGGHGGGCAEVEQFTEFSASQLSLLAPRSIAYVASVLSIVTAISLIFCTAYIVSAIPWAVVSKLTKSLAAFNPLIMM
jgi:hypothetical protein